MQYFPIPTFENERQRSLDSYQIMDTEREQEYDDIAELASFICGTPVSLITFIDDDRQWFKATVGTDFTENTREDSFCTFVLPEPDELLVIPDTRKDERFRDNPLVVDTPNVNFYAGVALKSREGLPIGTLCVLDVKPNQLNGQQEKALRTLADQTSKLLELRRINIETTKAAKLSQATLQAKIDEQITELKDRNSRLERVSEEVKRMVYIASHDLKEPVRKLKVYTDLLGESEEKTELFGKSLTRINRIADHIIQIISDINDYSDANLSNDDIGEVSLNNLMKNTQKKYALDIVEKGANIQVTKLPDTRGNKKQLQSVFDNIVHNSLKYTCGQPFIEITASEVKGDEIESKAELRAEMLYDCITFKDNGIGFEPQYVEKIFEFFQRLHTRQEFKGNGIGLAIVKKVIINHGGWVSASSTLGQGATFKIYLPKNKVLV